MIRKVCDYVKLNNMMEKRDGIVVGVSGGADSTCLLYILSEVSKEYEAKLVVVHVNHGIRGKEAERDEHFVAELCKKLELEYHCFHIDVRKLAKEESLSEEEAGRKVRYQAFLEVCHTAQCSKIAIAHNTNDNAETILFQMFRGTGIKGLCGIDPVSQRETSEGIITVIRPLLCLSRQEIEDYMQQHELSFQTDSTNLCNDYSRNKIRNQVLTYVTKEINQNAIMHISGVAAQLKEIEQFVEKSVRECYTALVDEREHIIMISVGKLKREDIVIQKWIIRRILENLAGSLKDLEAKHVEQVMSLYTKQVGKQIHLPYGMVIQRGYNEIKFYSDKASAVTVAAIQGQMQPVEIKIPGRLYLPQNRKFLEASVVPYKKNEPIPKNSCVKWFDYDKIENAVLVRNRKEGDYIQINSSGGNKKLKDYFIDQKVPREERAMHLLIADGNHIMWILGEGDRISEKYKVEDNTNRILLIKLIDTEENENGR